MGFRNLIKGLGILGSRPIANAALAAVAGAMMIAAPACAGTVVQVLGTDDIYNAGAPGTEDGTTPIGINVTGLTSITFSNATGLVYLNLTSGDNLNDADGIGSAPSFSSNTGANSIAGLTAPNAGYITGVFLGSTTSPTPSPLDFSGGTSFTSLSPELQQAFFVGDGLTGDGTGTTQTFYVPPGATMLYLGISDACGYNGSPSCYGDNGGFFDITVNGLSAVPEPSTWSLMILGLGMLMAIVRRDRRRQGLAAA
jgi:hypothetical protein